MPGQTTSTQTAAGTISPFARHWRLRPDVDFLNHGSFGACPIPVLDFQSHLRRKMEEEPVQFLWRHFETRLDPVRQKLAEFLAVDPPSLVLIQNATAGVNAVVRSLGLQPGDELLTTSLDYNACRNVLVAAASQHRAEVVIAPVPFRLTSSQQVVDAVMAKVTRRTRLALIDHVTSDTGMVLPVETIATALQARGVETVVDGAHAPGMLELNLSKLGVAAYTGNLHKWVCAPKGAAFLYVRPDLQSQVQPPVISHGNNRPRPEHTPFQDRFDWNGTFDPTAWFSIGQALDFMGGLLPGGWSELRAANRRLAVAARKTLCDTFEVPPPCPDSMLGSLATIPLPDRFQDRPPVAAGKLDADQVDLYDHHHIEVPFMRFGVPARRYLRISAQIYNTPVQYERLGRIVSRLTPR